MKHAGLLAVCAALGASSFAMADLARVAAEPNLEKRSRLALENAESALKASRQQYDAGDVEQSRKSIDEAVASVNLSLESLKQTGKNPSRSSKHFKSAEMKTRSLLKQLAAFSDEMSAADRAPVEKARESVQQVHDILLKGIMEGWK